MASSFYYLIGSLPYLKLGEPAPLKSAEFLAMCQNFISDRQLQTLSELTLVPRRESSCSVETVWNDFETDLRNWTVRIRAQRLRRDGDEYLRVEGDLAAAMEQNVTEALDQKTPLDTEMRLDEMRWQKLNDLTVGHEFDFQRLVIYRLQLSILEKWGHHQKPEGLKNLNQAIETLQDSSHPKNRDAESEMTE